MWHERLRKMLFGLVGLGFLAGGVWYLSPVVPVLSEKIVDPVSVASYMSAVAAITTAKVSLYSAFKDGVWLIVGAVMVGNVGEHIAGAVNRVGGTTPPPPEG